MTIFDQITLLLLATGLVIQLSLFILWRWRRQRKQAGRHANRLKRAGLGLFTVILVCQLTVIYGSLIEPQWLEVTYTNIELPSAAGKVMQNEPTQKLKIAVVADLHLGPYKGAAYVSRVVEEINALNPDILLMPGDFIYSRESQADGLAPLSKLNQGIIKLATLGNHDYGISRNIAGKVDGSLTKSAYVKNRLEQAGVRVLSNENLTLFEGEKQIRVTGLEDLWGFTGQFADDLFADSETPTIILEHNPDIILDPRAKTADLVVSGHTHGGQVRLPIIGAIAPLPTKLGRDFDRGLFKYADSSQLFITRGAGEMGPRARLFNRPEIAVLDISY
jgi:predicted MPP superfamily phosphohydrolase